MLRHKVLKKTCLNVFISTYYTFFLLLLLLLNTGAREPKKKQKCVYCLSRLCFEPLPFHLSRSVPSSLASRVRAKGELIKGGKVEHKSLRSIFSGTLTQRKGYTRTNDNTIYIKTLTHINVRPAWL